ncbi:uncharacterized protein PSFLO_05064 [Pseudozyma flocculosa]|uniref:Uncharacterized protein n=1 Tax=Pseudozyma flocculosa TaxID=84751 RepID=A0A5C3F500_9BASI|nr:uncharacterized protein PSFLO_05064 [Pseudozyma flocculosa]
MASQRASSHYHPALSSLASVAMRKSTRNYDDIPEGTKHPSTDPSIVRRNRPTGIPGSPPSFVLFVRAAHSVPPLDQDPTARSSWPSRSRWNVAKAAHEQSSAQLQ